LQRKWNQKAVDSNLYSTTEQSYRKKESDHYELGMKYALREKDTEDVLARNSELDSKYSELKSHFGSKKYNSR
jgi:hypothetical protein